MAESGSGIVIKKEDGVYRTPLLKNPGLLLRNLN